MECPSCGNEFQRLGMHWWHGTCPYPKISQRRKEMIIGSLMGDGSIPANNYTHILRLPMINKTFLKWFDHSMGVMTTGVRKKKTAAQLAENNRRSGFSPQADPLNYHDMYTVFTRTHPLFDKLRTQWYMSGKKRFPGSLKLTPLIAKLWYVSDGYLDVGKWGRPRIEIKSLNERNNAKQLISLFEDIGLHPVYARHELRFTCDDTERLVSWMGHSPPGFEYKWAIESRRRYHELKERAYSEYTTQTLKE